MPSREVLRRDHAGPSWDENPPHLPDERVMTSQVGEYMVSKYNLNALRGEGYGRIEIGHYDPHQIAVGLGR